MGVLSSESTLKFKIARKGYRRICNAFTKAGRHDTENSGGAIS